MFNAREDARVKELLAELASWWPILAILAAGIASYIGVVVGQTKLEAKYDSLHQDMVHIIHPRLNTLGKRSHDANSAILKLDGRIAVAERDIEYLKGGG